jgi:hypothetical protein
LLDPKPPSDLHDVFSQFDEPQNRHLQDETYAVLCKALDLWEAALPKARRLTGLPHGRHRTVYPTANIPLTSFEVDDKLSQVVNLLTYSALRHSEEGHFAEALADCRGIVNAGRSLGDAPSSLDQVMRNSVVRLGCRAAERVLGQGEPPPGDLAALQRLLEDEIDFPAIRCCLRGDRALLHERFCAVKRGEMPANALPGGQQFVPDGWQGRLVRSWLEGEHRDALLVLTRQLDACELPVHEQLSAAEALVADAEAHPRRVVPGEVAFQCRRTVQSCCRKQALAACMAVCLAVERYRQTRGRWPESLSDLKPGELAAVPLDPFDGQPIRYRRLADGVVVYSVGDDRTDDGGTFPVGVYELKPGIDLGFRLWDPDQRGLPAVAAPPEVKP